MIRGLSGQHVVTKSNGEDAVAFVPCPLPPEPSLDLSGEIQRLLERAIHALGVLDSVSLLLPEPVILWYAFVRREALYSSQIEGLRCSFSDLLMFEMDNAARAASDDIVEVSSCAAAIELGLARLDEGAAIDNRLVREMHDVLFSYGRGRGKSSGHFRKSQNWVGGARPRNAQFVPPPPAAVDTCMSELESFVHDDSVPYPHLVKAALIHVQFETIHPFLDGNGRIGRILIQLLLHQASLLNQPLLYLSLFFKKHRSEYYRLLDLVRHQGDWESWVRFFLEGVLETASNAVDTARKLLGLMTSDSSKIHAVGRSASTTLRVFDALCRRPITNISDLSERTKISFPTVKNALANLENLGIVKERTGNRRNRVFVYESYMRLLSDER